jgi:hypothetical protein
MKNNKKEDAKLNKMSAKLLEAGARAELDGFLKISCKDFAATLDFTKGYEIMDEEMPYYVPKSYLEQENAFTLFVKATLKTGKSCRFLANVVWLGDGKYAVGIANVPNNVVRGVYMPSSDN